MLRLVFLIIGFSQLLVLGEEQISLDGTWKFHAFELDGSDFRSIKLQEGDVVVDNGDSSGVTIEGKWNRNTVDRHDVPYVGDDFLRRWYHEGDLETYVRYEPDLPKSGYYEHYVRFPYGAMLHARYDIRHEGGVESKYVSQRNRCGYWIYLGTYELKQGESHVTLTSDSAGDVVADAVMFRPVAREKVEKVRRDRDEVFRPDFDDSSWVGLKVPGHWGMINEYSNYTGKGWYRREFSIPQGMVPGEGEQLKLRFGAVYHVARVYLNGEFLGEHQGGFTPFEFDVTGRVNVSGPNHLAVEANNDFLVGATWNWGGIIREVSLAKINEVSVAYQYVHAEPDLERGDAKLKIKLRVRNDSSDERELKVSSEILREKRVIGTVEKVVRVPEKSVKELSVEVDLDAKDVKLWHFDHPNLYAIDSKVEEGGSVLHGRKDRFGIRKVEVTPDGMLLNGERVRLSGFNRVSDHRYWGSSEPQEVIDRDVDLMKNANANFMRIMHGTQHKRLLDRCDEKGILIFEEVNVRELANPEFTAPDYPLAKQWLREMVERDINHPSIIGWSVGNELKEHFDYAKLAIDYVRTELDPYRLVTCVSNTGAREDATPETDPIGFGDLVMQNCYEQTPERMIDSIRSKWPDQSIFFSEFSTGRFNEPSLDLEMVGLKTWNDCIRGQREFVIGGAPWTFNDYRSGYVKTLEDENRCWGIVDVWRQKRRFFDQARNEYSPIRKLVMKTPDLAEGSVDVKLLVRGPDDYPSYRLKGYVLAWAFHDGDGKVIQEGEENLPLIKPEQGSWKGRIKWGKDATKAAELIVEVRTPNGYVRHRETKSFTVPSMPEVTGIVAADQAVRVFFTKPIGAEECYVKLHDGSGEIVRSSKTIDTFADVTGISNLKEYELEVVACNGAGESEPSSRMPFRCSGKSLPPVIKHASIKDGSLVIGYTGEMGDEEYTVRYGEDPNLLSEELVLPNRGMLVIPLKGMRNCSVKIKRLGVAGESEWSNVVTATKPFGLKLGKVPMSAKFDGGRWSNWGGSLVKGEDGLYHMFYSRWEKEFGWAWVTDSEIAHAVSESPFGPFEFKDVALPPRGAEFWDGLCTHNPTVHKFDGKYCLYYMGNTGDGVRPEKGLNVTHRNNQRIGVAVADSPNGPWKRFDQPVIDVIEDPEAIDALMASNPSVVQRPEGGYLMVYKAVGKKKPGPFGGPVVHCVATSDSPTGPFVKYGKPVFLAEGHDFPAEDPYIWHQDGKYRAILKDMNGAFTDAGQALVFFDSEDGFDWKLAENPLVTKLELFWENGEHQKLQHLERPQLYIENGKPVALLCAGDTEDEEGVLHSFNVQIPIRE